MRFGSSFGKFSALFPPTLAAHFRGSRGRRLAPGQIPLHQDIERILLDEDDIRERLGVLSREITATYHGSEFTVVSVLKGSCVFAADLIRRLPIPLQLTFAAVSSYRSGTTSGELAVRLLPEDGEIAGRQLLVVDDILDSGRTLSALVAELSRRGAAEVRTCVFLDKPSRRVVSLQPHFVGFEVEDLFVVGYGLDHAGRYRNLPYVAALKPEVLLAPGSGSRPSS